MLSTECCDASGAEQWRMQHQLPNARGWPPALVNHECIADVCFFYVLFNSLIQRVPQRPFFALCTSMAVGKNKRLSKGKKGKGKKAIDPFKEKEWYELKAPAVFTHRNIGKTIVSRTKGTHVASEALKGRIVEANLADLNKDEDAFFRKFKLEILDVENRTAKTQFYGMDFTTDKVRSLVKKWQTLIDTHLDVTTTDGYKLRLFCVAFTKKRQNCLRKTYYASTAQIKVIRKKIFEIMAKESACELKDLIKKFVAETIGSAIEKASEVALPNFDPET
jgi:small subunit ribosomal protein S3Ae